MPRSSPAGGLSLQQPLIAARAAEKKENDDAEAGATVLQTALNMLNELEGSGLLGMPYALRLGGWASIPCLVRVVSQT